MLNMLLAWSDRNVVVSPTYFSYCILNTASSPDHVNCKYCLVISVDTVKRLIVLIVVDLTLVPKPGTDEMASNGSICVPEPLQHEDARSWFKLFELCAAANEWNAAKQLLRLPTLLRGRSWAIYESLGDDDKESYDKLKKAILDRLIPDSDEHRLAAREQLS